MTDTFLHYIGVFVYFPLYLIIIHKTDSLTGLFPVNALPIVKPK